MMKRSLTALTVAAALALPLAAAAALFGDSGASGEAYEARIQNIDKAKAGDHAAQYAVGMSFCCGDGEYQDVQKATWWLCEAARKNHKEAQFMMGQIYRTDRNIEMGEDALASYPQLNDDVLAYVWMKIADKSGVPGAKEEWQKIKTNLSSAKLREAESMIPFYPYVPCEIEVGDTAQDEENPIRDSDSEPAAGGN